MKFALVIISFIIIAVIALLILLPKDKMKSQDDIAEGKKIYEGYCKSCHSLFKEATGPPMYGALERIPNKKWLYNFIRNTDSMSFTDPYAICLKNKYGSLMTMFQMPDKVIDIIYSYVYYEAKKDKAVWNNPKFFIRCK